jgi:hypothetical protein
MGDARNVYPRLCWGCLAIIEDFAHDYANLNYGGFCSLCNEKQPGELPGLRDMLRTESAMNSVAGRDVLVSLLAK